MNRTLIVTALAALVCASPSLAAAQGSDEERAARAQEAFDSGAAFYMEGKYGRALVEFKKANRALPNPMFVLNMGFANGRLGNYEDALDDVASAREQGGLSPQALALADGASQAWSANILATSLATSLAEARAESRAELLSDPADLDPKLLADLNADPGPSVLGTLGIVSLSLAVAGGVGTAVHYVTVFQPTNQALEDAAGDEQSVIDERLEDARGQQALGQALLFTSVGFGVLGGVFLVLDSSNSSESARITPLLGPGVAGARVDFTF